MIVFRTIDFETTGEPGPDRVAGIIEAGFTDVYLDLSGQVTPPLYSWLKFGNSIGFLVNPGIPVNVEARAVHHITDAEIETGCSQEVAKEALQAAGAEGTPDYFVAHNAAFEKAFFPGEFKWLCTYKIALRLWPDAPRHSNQVLRYWLGLDVEPHRCEPPHRAKPDAYVTAHILHHMLARILKSAAGIDDVQRSLDWMLKVSAEPPMPDKIGFGKHKGVRWRDLPADYLLWIAEKSDMESDAKWLARHWLDKKDTA